MEHLAVAVTQIQEPWEQLLEIQDFRKALTRIERSVDSIRGGDLGSTSRPVRRKVSGASTSAKEVRARLGDRTRMDVLEEQTARQLQQKLRRKSGTIGEEDVEPLEPNQQPEVDTIGLHQPSSFDSSPESGRRAKAGYQASASLTSVSPKQTLELKWIGGSRDLVTRFFKQGRMNADAETPSRRSKLATVESNDARFCRRKSLDELQADHNAAITAPGGAASSLHASVCVALRASRLSITTEGAATALPWLGWFLLSCVGILDFYEASLSC
eukprot:s306_g4.t1